MAGRPDRFLPGVLPGSLPPERELPPPERRERAIQRDWAPLCLLEMSLYYSRLSAAANARRLFGIPGGGEGER